MSYCQIFFHHTSQKNSDLHIYNTRSKNEPHFQLFTTSLGQRSIKFKGCQLWCSLQMNLDLYHPQVFSKLNCYSSYKPCNINVVWCDILLKRHFHSFLSVKLVTKLSLIILYTACSHCLSRYCMCTQFVFFSFVCFSILSVSSLSMYVFFCISFIICIT